MTTSTQDLHPLLDDLLDTRELIVRRIGDEDAAVAVWRSAAADARERYAAWRGRPGRAARVAYEAAEDQADAALASLRAATG